MSVLTSASVYPLNFKPQMSFSSQSAFKTPSLPKKHRQAYNGSSFVPKDDDPDVIILQPTKKFKGCSGAVIVTAKPQDNKNKSSRLTIEEVFNVPSELNRGCSKDLVIDDFADDGSSLSFISSCSSLESLEDVILIEDKANEDCQVICGKTGLNHDVGSASLVMKDDVMNKLNNLMSSQLGSEQFKVFQPSALLQRFPWGEQNLAKSLVKPLAYIDSVNLPLAKLSDYLQEEADFSSEVNLFAKNVGQKSKGNTEEGDDSYLFVSRSTSIEQESTPGSTQSQKGESPNYRGLFEVLEEEKKSQKSANKTKKETVKQNKPQKKIQKEKPAKVQRQGLFTVKISLEKTLPVQVEQPEVTTVAAVYEPASTQADIPTLSFESLRGKRPDVQVKWSPEAIDRQDFEKYLEQLSWITGSVVTDQEAAVKLLKSFGMNVSLTLEIVSQTKSLYKEMFRVKVKRLRRNGGI